MNKKYVLKIAFSILFSLIISFLLNDYIFIKNTPRLKPTLKEDVLLSMETMSHSIKNIQLPSIQFPNLALPQNAPSQYATVDSVSNNTNLSFIGNGVYAQNSPTSSYLLIKENEIQWKIYSFEINGKTIIVKVPVDDVPPSQESIKPFFE